MADMLEDKIEAVLFMAGEPIRFERLSKLLGVEDEEIASAVERLAARANGGGGLRVVVHEDAVQLATAPEHSALIETFAKGDLKEELTLASLETLSVVAYAGPVKRSSIDFIRGVNSSYTLRNLLLRGLIERSGGGGDGRGYAYVISFDLLRRLGLVGVEKLPNYETMRKEIHVLIATIESSHAAQSEAPESETA